MQRGLQRGLKGSIPLSSTGGDVLISARTVDAVGIGDDYLAMGSASLSFDVKVLDKDTGNCWPPPRRSDPLNPRHRPSIWRAPFAASKG